MENINNVIFSDKIVTLYHVTLLSNYDSIEEYGLDPDKAVPGEIPKAVLDKYCKEMEELLGRPVTKLPYHYTHFPRCIYLGNNIKDAVTRYGHAIKKGKVPKGDKLIILKIEIPESYLNSIKCNSPKLLGAKSWQEYRNLLLIYEPEYIIDRIKKGITVSELDKVIQRMYKREEGVTTVRGVIPPNMITRVK